MIGTPKEVLRVLVVEDSLTASLLIKKILTADPDLMVVGTARTGQEAIDLTLRLKPDVITMDVNLPVLDGIEATKAIMAQFPTPILILSSTAWATEVQRVFKALSYGAVDVMSKDEVLSAGNADGESRLVRTIKFLPQVKMICRPPGRVSRARDPGGRSDGAASERLVAIVGSTGGPQAVSHILNPIPKNFPCGIAIVIHMARGFVEGFCRWLQTFTALKVKVGESHETIQPGVVYLAPAGWHMEVSGRHTIELRDGPPYKGLKPCGNYLLESVAKHYQKAGMGIILTGMGNDGGVGIQRMKEQGGRTIAQDEKTSVIFGMPKAAIKTQAVDLILPIGNISDEIIRWVRK